MDLAQAQEQIEDLTEEKEALLGQVERLEIKLEKVLRELRRRKSEKLDPQELLEGCLEFFTPEELKLLEEADAEDSDSTEADTEEEAPRRKRERKKTPPNLERRKTVVKLEKERCQCPHCSAEMEHLGFDVVEKWGHQPAVVYIQEFHLEKRVCSCGKGIASASIPPQPIPRGKALPDLLAQIVVAKYLDGLPFYRQSKIYGRAGLEIGDTTLVEWNRQVADVLEPVLFLMLRQVIQSGYVQADETGLRVQAKGGCERGYLWAYGNPNGQVYFDFRSDRSRDGPVEILEDFEGYLQTDGYAGYNEVARGNDVLHFACWAHARRYFVEAKEKSKARAGKVLKFVQKLYRIEKRAREQGLGFEARRTLRQREAQPVLDAIKIALDTYANEPKFRPKSPLGEAVGYSLRRWALLTRYVDCGEVEIDNNLIENSMRVVAVARKNFLFAGSEEGAHRAARLFSIVESCRRLKINPQEYLTDVLTRIRTTPQSELKNLTPARWKQANSKDA